MNIGQGIGKKRNFYMKKVYDCYKDKGYLKRILLQSWRNYCIYVVKTKQVIHAAYGDYIESVDSVEEFKKKYPKGRISYPDRFELIKVFNEMTKDEVKNYIELNDKFIDACEHVKEFMRQYDEDYNDVYDWIIEDDTVKGSGDVYSRNCFMGTTVVMFDPELLTYTDEELQKHVDKLIKEREKEKEKQRKQKEKEERDRDLAELKRLQKKYGRNSI